MRKTFQTMRFEYLPRFLAGPSAGLLLSHHERLKELRGDADGGAAGGGGRGGGPKKHDGDIDPTDGNQEGVAAAQSKV